MSTFDGSAVTVQWGFWTWRLTRGRPAVVITTVVATVFASHRQAHECHAPGVLRIDCKCECVFPRDLDAAQHVSSARLVLRRD